MHIRLAKASPYASPPPSLKFHPPPWQCCKPVERNGTWHMQWRSHRMRGPHAHAPAWHSPPTTLLGPVETTTPLARMRSLPGFAPAPFHLRGRTAARQFAGCCLSIVRPSCGSGRVSKWYRARKWVALRNSGSSETACGGACHLGHVASLGSGGCERSLSRPEGW